MSSTTEVRSSQYAPSSSLTEDVDFNSAQYNEEQVRLMEEVCIVIDENDKPIRPGTKKECTSLLQSEKELMKGHLMVNINKGLLHRAFSLFLFNPSTKKLLMQQRATEKITFPDQWTNTCCSHPLHTTSELGYDLSSSIEGVKRAAQRKLDHELGIKAVQVPVEKMKFLTRIHYLSPSGTGLWGEHESTVPKIKRTGFDGVVDYIIVIIADVDLDVNPNEVRDTRYVSPDELKEMFKQPGMPCSLRPVSYIYCLDLQFTPWFKLICQQFLYEWWENLDNLEKFTDQKEVIYRMI